MQPQVGQKDGDQRTNDRAKKTSKDSQAVLQPCSWLQRGEKMFLWQHLQWSSLGSLLDHCSWASPSPKNWPSDPRQCWFTSTLPSLSPSSLPILLSGTLFYSTLLEVHNRHIVLKAFPGCSYCTTCRLTHPCQTWVWWGWCHLLTSGAWWIHGLGMMVCREGKIDKTSAGEVRHMKNIFWTTARLNILIVESKSTNRITESWCWKMKWGAMLTSPTGPTGRGPWEGPWEGHNQVL